MDKFQGFPKDKQTWDFPNVINGWVHKLTGAEFKCLWYVLRHTYGWQKTKDTISISQFMKGIKKKNGEWLDNGTGLSNRKIIDALKKLEEYGFIKSYKKDRRTTVYEVVKKVHKGSEVSSQVACEESSQTIPSITIPSKQYIEQSSNFSYKAELEKLEKSSRKIDKITSHYFARKGFTFNNKEQYQNELKRAFRSAKALTGYNSEQIDKTMDYCDQEYPDLWTLETIVKRIAHIINK